MCVCMYEAYTHACIPYVCVYMWSIYTWMYIQMCVSYVLSYVVIPVIEQVYRQLQAPVRMNFESNA